MFKWKRLWLWVGPAAVLAVACGGAAAPTATPTRPPAAATATATQAAAPGATAAPTRPPAAATAAPAATATPRPTAAPAAKRTRGAIVYAMVTDIGANDPLQGSAGIDTLYYKALYGQVSAADTEGVMRPSAGESWRQVDPTHVEIKFRKDVVFHNGMKLTARDFMQPFIECEKFPKLIGCGTSVFLKQVIDQEGPAEQAFQFPDQYTVRVSLGTPNATWLMDAVAPLGGDLRPLQYLLDAGDNAPEVIEKKPVGAGPYRYGDRVKAEFIKLAAFDQWYGPVLSNDRLDVKDVTIRFIPESQARIAAIKTGEVDIVESVLPIDAQALEREREIKLARVFPFQFIQIIFSTHPAAAKIPGTDLPSPVMNKRVREALIMAVDKNAIVQGIMRGMAQPTKGAWNPPLAGADPAYIDANPIPYNPQRARQILQEEKFPFDQDFKLYSYRSSPGAPEATEAVCGMWNQVGVKCKFTLADVGVLVNDTWQQPQKGTGVGTFPFHMIRWQTQIADPYGFLTYSGHTKGFLSQLSDPVMDQLWDAHPNVFGLEERDAHWRKAFRRMWDERLQFTLYQDVLIFGVGRRVNWDPPGAAIEPYGLERVQWRPGFP